MVRSGHDPTSNLGGIGNDKREKTWKNLNSVMNQSNKGVTVSRVWDRYMTPWKTLENPTQPNVTLKGVMKGWC
jgi:hypothetical protein